MIQVRQLTFTFPETSTPLFENLNLSFGSGEFALICGPTGGGKSTLLKALNGLVPAHSSGRLSGEIWLDDTQIAGKKPHQLAHLIGYVNQQPEGAFVSDLVIEELAYGMEQLGIDQETMRARIAEIANRLQITQLLESPLDSLSGGEQQRVAIAAALVAGQRVLLLDEPTSALDVASAAALLNLLKDLAHTQRITVIVVEHRIERVLDLVDTITLVRGDSTAIQANRAQGFDDLLATTELVPPVIEIGKKLGWSPLPLNISDARATWLKAPQKILSPSPLSELPAALEAALTVSELTVEYDGVSAVSNLSFQLEPATITALFGPNGSGKTTTLWAVQGHLPHLGSVKLGDGTAPANLKPLERLRHIAMVPQSASDLLLLETVGSELSESDSFAGAEARTTATIFESLVGRIDPNQHPRDLSAGQQLALVLALQLAKGASILLLDEPTRGLDYAAKNALAQQLDKLRVAGITVLLASHDVEFIAIVADYVMLLNHGQLEARGTALQVLKTLGDHAPQTWQITRQYLRAQEVLSEV